MEEHPAIKHNQWIQSVAYALTRNRYDLYEDVAQEMRLYMVEHPDKPDNCLKFEARNRAKDFLRSKKAGYSYKSIFVHISTELTDRLGVQIDTEGNIYSPDKSPRSPINEENYGDSYRVYSYSDYISFNNEQGILDSMTVSEIMNNLTPGEKGILYRWFWLGLKSPQEAKFCRKSPSWVRKRRIALAKKIRCRYERT